MGDCSVTRVVEQIKNNRRVTRKGAASQGVQCLSVAKSRATGAVGLEQKFGFARHSESDCGDQRSRRRRSTRLLV